MRRVRATNYSNNPMVMFAQGAESLIAEKINHTSHYEDFELKAMLRKEQIIERESRIYQISRKYNLVEILKNLLWGKREA